ncbi:MAG TPA: hypothetical protein VGC67_06045 [Cellulomonas sp.]
MTLGQAVGFEGARRADVTDCPAGTDCPLTGTVDEGMAQVVALLGTIEQTPLTTTGDRELTGELAQTGTFQAMCSETRWPYLGHGPTTAQVLEVAPVLGDTFGYEGLFRADRPVPMVGGLDDCSAEGAAPAPAGTPASTRGVGASLIDGTGPAEGARC